MKYMNFTQTVTVHCREPDELIRMAEEWDELHASADVMGYIGTHVLADRDEPGRYIIVAEFAVVDPEVSAAEEAMRNNERAVTKAWAQRLREITDGEPVYRNYDELYRTG